MNTNFCNKFQNYKKLNKKNNKNKNNRNNNSFDWYQEEKNKVF